MNLVRSYYVALDGEKKIMAPQGATPFGCALIPRNGDAPALVRVWAAINDERPLETREIFCIPEDQDFVVTGDMNLKYVGTVQDPAPSEERIPKLIHVLITDPKPARPAHRQVRMEQLPPEIQAQLRAQILAEQAKAQEQPAATPAEGGS